MSVKSNGKSSFRLIYIAIGKSAKDSCTDSSFPYEWQNQCLKSCPSDCFPHSYSNGGKSCLNCPKKLNMILDNGKCECMQGFTLEKKICIPVSTSSRRN